MSVATQPQIEALPGRMRSIKKTAPKGGLVSGKWDRD